MIGLKRGTVKLVSHNSKWAELFEEEKYLLKKTFGDTIIAIEHIGSTAIPDILAKPIIDINIGVKSLEVAGEMKEKFEKLGYEHRPFVSGKTKNVSKWQELYVRGTEAKRTHYVHVTVFGGSYWKNDLLFRDFLRKNPERAKQYVELKKQLAEKYADNRAIYTENKEQFIQETLKMAKNDIESFRLNKFINGEKMKTLNIYTDGGARGNPGPAGIGAVFKLGEETVAHYKDYIGETTNNQAEYMAVVLAVSKLSEHSYNQVNFFLDSQLVVNQMNGLYKIKNEDLKPLYRQIKDNLIFEKYTFNYISREKNQEADKLVNLAIDDYLKSKKFVLDKDILHFFF